MLLTSRVFMSSLTSPNFSLLFAACPPWLFQNFRPARRMTWSSASRPSSAKMAVSEGLSAVATFYTELRPCILKVHTIYSVVPWITCKQQIHHDILSTFSVESILFGQRGDCGVSWSWVSRSSTAVGSCRFHRLGQRILLLVSLSLLLNFSTMA